MLEADVVREGLFYLFITVIFFLPYLFYDLSFFSLIFFMTCHFSPFLILTFLSLFSLLYFSYPFIFREGLLKEEKELTSRVESGAADPEESTRLTEVFQSLEAIDSAKAPARAAVILSGIAILSGSLNRS